METMITTGGNIHVLNIYMYYNKRKKSHIAR